MTEQSNEFQRQPILLAPPAVTFLAAGMIALHALLQVLGPAAQSWTFRHFAFVPYEFFALFGDRQLDTPVQTTLTLVTHAFLHGDWAHLLINMGMFLAFGSLVERAYRIPAFLAFFVIGAASGALTQTVFEGGQAFVMIGASGAVYCMMGVVVRLLLQSKNPAGRKRAVVLAAVLMALNLFGGLMGVGDLLAGAQIAWQAHLGGFVTGFLVTFLIRPQAR